MAQLIYEKPYSTWPQRRRPLRPVNAVSDRDLVTQLSLAATSRFVYAMGRIEFNQRLRDLCEAGLHRGHVQHVLDRHMPRRGGSLLMRARHRLLLLMPDLPEPHENDAGLIEAVCPHLED